MASLSHSLSVAVQAAFVLLALATLFDWLRHRDQRRTFLVLALVTLSALALLGPFSKAVNLPSALATDLGIIVLLLSGYFLLLFRDALVPLGTRTKAAITAVIALVAAVDILAALPSDPATPRSTFQVVAASLLVVTWVLCVAEPIFRFAVASIGRPAVEGARLRALSLGYIGLVAIIVVGTLLGSGSRTTGYAVGSDIVALLIAPILYASFSPPEWLRRIWAYPEQDELRRAWHDLLLFSPDRQSLARRALDWGTRLVGGAAAYIVDADGSILAARGITEEAALAFARGKTMSDASFSVPLELEGGNGSLMIIGGPFTPVFGEYELTLLRGYAVSITAGLNRVSLTERITALEKAKTEFLNLASHELRAPMTVIKGYLTMLEAGTLGPMPPTAEKIFPMLVAKSDEITSMLEQMIEASRLEEGRMALKKQRSDIVELTDDAIGAVEPLLADKRMIDFEKPAGELWANVDPDRYEIVVRNLLSNAVKYSAAGSDVKVRLASRAGHAMLEVIDEGVGIAKEDQARLFTRFGRIENKSTAHTSGTGLGLWLSREIARMHDGDLTVDSEVDKGTTFTLEIPLDTNDPDRSAGQVAILDRPSA
jgi:signal transduction histidine kinase